MRYPFFLALLLIVNYCFFKHTGRTMTTIEYPEKLRGTWKLHAEMHGVITKLMIFGLVAIFISGCSSSVRFTTAGASGISSKSSHKTSSAKVASKNSKGVNYGSIARNKSNGGTYEEETFSHTGETEGGYASYYGDQFDGRKTASGEIFDQNKLTAAHKTLPFGSIVRVTNMKNGKNVTVEITDRGPFAAGRIIDLSTAAARKIDMISDGVVPVELFVVK